MSEQKKVNEKLKEIGKHGFIYGLGTGLESLIQIFLLPVYLNKFSAEEYGIFSLIQLTAAMAAGFFYLGGTSALTNFYFDFKGNKNILFSNALFLTLLGSVLMLGVFWTFGELILEKILGDAVFIEPYYFLFLSFAISIINTIYFVLLRLRKKSKIFVLLKIFSLVSTIVFVLGLLNYMQNKLLATSIGFVLGQTCIFLFLVFRFRKSVVFSINSNLIKKILKFGMPLAFSGIIFVATDWIIRFFVSSQLGLDNLGIYSMALRFGAIIMASFIMPFALIWGVVRLQYRHDENTASFFSQITTYYFLIGLLLIFAISVNVDPLFRLLGSSDEYSDCVLLVPILLFSQLMFGGINIFDFGICINNKTIITTGAHLISFFIVLLLSALAIKSNGVFGAAIIHLIGNFILVSVIFIGANRYFEIKINFQRLLPLLIIFFLFHVFLNYSNIAFGNQGVAFSLIKNNFLLVLFIWVSLSHSERLCFLNNLRKYRDLAKIFVKL